MFIRSFTTAAVMAAACITAPIAQAGSNTYTTFGSVTSAEAGWAADAMSIVVTSPFINPAGCAVTNAGYATLPTDPGRNLYHTMVLSALLNGKRVQLLIHGTLCAFNKPRVIAVRMVP